MTVHSAIEETEMPGPNSEPHAMRNDGRTFGGKTELARVGIKSGEGLSWERKPANQTKRAEKIRARKTRTVRSGRTRRS